MKILTVTNSIELGGSARIALEVARGLKQPDDLSTIISFRELGQSDYPVSSDYGTLLSLHTLVREERGLNKIAEVARLLYRLRVAVKRLKPDIIISHIDESNLQTIIATFGLKIPILCVSQMHPTRTFARNSQSNSFLSLILSVLRFLLYPFAARIVVLAESHKEALPRHLHQSTVVIPNFVINSDSQLEDVRLPKNSIVSLGRLVPQKRFDLLIDSFASISERFPEWTLHIFGIGYLQEELEKQIENLHLSNRVFLRGMTQAPLKVFQQAEIVAIASDFEGMPLVLLEALSVGSAVLTTEFIGDAHAVLGGSNAAVVVERGDHAKFVSGLEKMLIDKNFREELRYRALEVGQQFIFERIIVTWRKLVKDIVENNRK